MVGVGLKAIFSSFIALARERGLRFDYRPVSAPRTRSISRGALTIAAGGCIVGLALWPDSPQLRFVTVLLCVVLPLLFYFGLPWIARCYTPKWTQFRLGSFLLFIGLAALGLKLLEPYYGHTQLISEVARLKGKTYTKPTLPDWMPSRIGSVALADHFHYVHDIWLDGASDTDVALLANTPGADRVRNHRRISSAFDHG
jgi:hypothetical protein